MLVFLLSQMEVALSNSAVMVVIRPWLASKTIFVDATATMRAMCRFTAAVVGTSSCNRYVRCSRPSCACQKTETCENFWHILLVLLRFLVDNTWKHGPRCQFCRTGEGHNPARRAESCNCWPFRGSRWAALGKSKIYHRKTAARIPDQGTHGPMLHTNKWTAGLRHRCRARMPRPSHRLRKWFKLRRRYVDCNLRPWGQAVEGAIVSPKVHRGGTDFRPTMSSVVARRWQQVSAKKA